MDHSNNALFSLPQLTELQAKREWLVGLVGGGVCYGLILWLC